MSWLLATSLLAAAPALAAEDGQAPAVTAPVPAPPEPAPSPPEPAPAFPAQPGPVGTPGFLNEIGRWWQDSVTNFNAGMKASQARVNDNSAQAAKDAAAATDEAMKNAADAAKDAAIAVARLPNTRVIETRERCAAAANGAPDCRAAAANACRGKGFSDGQAFDIQSAQKCPATVWLSGRAPREGECPRETLVTRAVCQ